MSPSSWIPVPAGSDFPINNIPFGVFSPKTGGKPRVATAIGDNVIDLSELAQAGVFSNPDVVSSFVGTTTLNDFMTLGRPVWIEVRNKLISLFSDGPDADNTLRSNEELKSKVIYHKNDVSMHLPATIGDYTDFYSSKDHAYNVGVMFRGPANALQPNWTWLPVGYHGRSSSVVVSGVNFKRPCGQLQKDPKDPSQGAVYGPSKRMDFELEMGTWVGKSNKLGEPIPIEKANDYIFGMCLLNDWSARDIQNWEYVPLGPFGAKNFCTTISPWIITLEALEPYKCPTSYGTQDPLPLPYLQDPEYGSYDIQLDVALQPKDGETEIISRSNYKHMYWNLRQQLVHHTVTGCNMRVGDLLGSGTISGPTPDSCGSILELAWRGERPITLKDGTTRSFLNDYDCVKIYGKCEKDGISIGFGDCEGQLLPATPTHS